MVSILHNVIGQADIQSTAETFYRQFFVSGGAIVWFILLPMSIVMVYLAIDLSGATRRKRLLPSGSASEIATLAVRHGTGSLAGKLAGRTDLVSKATAAALETAHPQTESFERMRQRAAECLHENCLSLSRRAQLLQLVGTVAPMVGLFGTVYGMICAFNLLGKNAEGPRYEMLANSISVALVTTFWGLLVAIPAQFIYGMLQSRIESLVGQAAAETEALLARLFETSFKVGGPAAAPSSPEPKTEADVPAAKLVRQGTFIRRKQRKMPVLLQRPMLKRPANQ
ncbi:MAG: MotA/TolQ/ExbB proton channel family protein [Planctomycetaceae bacterium]|nr:MotA/TolQ/ExbB proton channel family protein [Planctomycetaceae bacterium]